MSLVVLTALASNVLQKRVSFSKYTYHTTVLPAARASPQCPPVLLVPPVGVGIDRNFFNRFLREWEALGSPCAMHAPDLLGSGVDAQPKPRRFYTPQVWPHVQFSCVAVCETVLVTHTHTHTHSHTVF